MEAKTKKILIIGSVILIAGIGVWVIRNRYKLRTHDKDVLDINTPFEKVQALGAIPKVDRQGANILVYRNYSFYTNNRAFEFDDNKKIKRRGSFNMDEITWDDKSPKTKLSEIFA